MGPDARRRILVVDDDADHNRIVKAVLRSAGYDSLSTTDSSTAVPLALRHHPDAILLDLRMPGHHGLTVLDWLRKGTSAPVIMVTGVDDAQTAVQSLRLGAYDYLTKPVDMQKLLQTLQLALSEPVGDTNSHLRVGRYRLQGEIGRGGMGVVYSARDDLLGRTVALKVLRPELGVDARFEQRPLAEAKSLARLSHGGVVAVYEAGRDRGRLYIAMEHVDGDNLRTVLDRSRAVSIEQAAKIGIDAADGLAAAHEAGLIHRDLKPSNLMISAQGAVKVIDFGLAHIKWGSDAAGRKISFAGTPAYAAPEQLLNVDIDARTDIYSLGMVLLEIVTGAAKLAREREPFSILRKILAGGPREIALRIETIPPRLRELLGSMLEIEPSRRPGAMAEVRAHLLQAVPKAPLCDLKPLLAESGT
jgi:CheY-like chemotaxis protein/predicted Ser/Thr protein kinase